MSRIEKKFQNRVFCLLPRSNICLFTNIIDSYEGIGIVRTIGKRLGLIEILVTPDTEKETILLINHLKKDLGIRIIDSQQLTILAKIDKS